MSLAFDTVLSWALFLGLPLAFLAIVVWVWRPGSRRRYLDDARIPFTQEDDDGHTLPDDPARP